MEFSVFRGQSPRYEFLLCQVVRFTCIRKGCKAELWVSDDLIYAKGRLKAAWVLYRTVAWALPTDSVYRNDGKRYGVFHVFVGEAHLPLSVVPNGECQVGLTVLALSLTLSRGEREQIVVNQNNGRTLPSLRGKENKLQGITTIVEVQSSDSLSPWERARERAKPFGTPLSRFSKNTLSKRIQTKEMVGHGYPTLFPNFKGLKNE